MKLIVLVFSSLITALAIGRAQGAVNCVHETVIYPAGKPSVVASFELTKVSRSATVCLFLKLNGDATNQENGTWQAGLTDTLESTLARGPATETDEGFRQDEVDSQGRIRRSTWTWNNGMIHQVVLFDANGQVLQLDRWRNQRWVPDDMAFPLVCGRSLTRSLAMRLSGGVAGQPAIQVRALEDLADRTTNYCLTKELGLPGDACNPSGLKASQYVPTPGRVLAQQAANAGLQTAGTAPGDHDPKGGASLRNALVLAPNPASDSVKALYTLDTEALVLLTVLNLSGETVAVDSLGDQGAGPHCTSLNVSDLASGLYVAALFSNSGGGRRLIREFKFAVKH